MKCIGSNSVAVQHNYDLFPELATTLHYFVEKLYATLLKENISNVYFLSREGQPLKRLFDIYCRRVGGGINSHYLEVSRRSTLLPSLAPLAEETFDTLFRQYRRISLMEFLSSLGLEIYCKDIVLALGLVDGEEFDREEDFPTSSIFLALKSSVQFQILYESERVQRRRAFLLYLSNLSGGELPSQLVVVDVGWKGTIQDNLHSLLLRVCDTRVRKVTGYYIGLIAAGAAAPSNDKYGLVFSALDEPTPKFRVFNENRALFEVVLAADHGSIVSYEVAADGKSYPIRGEFEEAEMLSQQVFPLQHQLFKNFERLLSSSLDGNNRGLCFDATVKAHARMMFNPSQRERAWFSSVFHVENYGVFQRSSFATADMRPKFLHRMHFLARLLLSGNTTELGFWPWSTLYERGGALPAYLYAFIRRLQR
ncbi:hypothetical protein [Pseudomonas sp.]|uniref:hypothetical protein n=1 Tax=Pseudomonas sp. TaxID=306 RepID=UPI00257B71FD|nr:hypothetical protein [Pseudomonas sp.]